MKGVSQAVVCDYKNTKNTNDFRPPKSSYTSMQRILSIMLLIQLAFFMNLVARGIPANRPEEHIGIYGFRVLERDVTIGLIVSPILAIVTHAIVSLLK